MKRLLAPALLALAMLSPAFAVSAKEGATGASDVFGHLTGRWQGQGTLQGNPVEAELAWEPVLGGRHVRMTYRAFQGEQTLFEGHAYYRPGESVRGVWFDSAGHIYEIRAKAGARELVSEWGDPEIERGQSTCSLGADEVLTVVDAVFTPEGALREFARITYRRAEG